MAPKNGEERCSYLRFVLGVIGFLHKIGMFFFRANSIDFMMFQFEGSGISVCQSLKQPASINTSSKYAFVL